MIETGKILVTGASGFVGQHLLKYLQQRNLFTETLSLRGVDNIVLPPHASTLVHLAGKAHDLKNISNESEYFEVNTALTQRLYQAFCNSNANTFIFISSVKAVLDNPEEVIDEGTQPNPATAYGKSKLAAEQHLIENQKSGTRLYILRPCMIHGPNNKGNLNLLYQLVRKGVPYPLGSFKNQRSYLSVDNLSFVINELIQRGDEIPTGVYNVADDDVFSTAEIVQLIGESLHKGVTTLALPTSLIKFIAKVGDKLNLSLTSERLQKLTETYLVSNEKIISAIGKPFPMAGKTGLLKTFNSFKN